MGVRGTLTGVGAIARSRAEVGDENCGPATGNRGGVELRLLYSEKLILPFPHKLFSQSAMEGRSDGMWDHKG